MTTTMPKRTLVPNKELIIAAIEADEALIAGAMVKTEMKLCGHMGHCAVGALLAFVGIDGQALRNLPNSAGDMWPLGREHYLLVEFQEPHSGQTFIAYPGHVLEEVYGLSKLNAERLMSLNDTCDVNGGSALAQAKLRAKRVIEWVEKEL